MLWKCYTQYASKFGKLSSGHRTGKGQFSFQSPRMAMPKNVQQAEEIKKRQEYTELYKKDLHNRDNHNGVITHTHLEPDILDCAVKWAWRSIWTKLVEVVEFQLSYFKSYLMMLWKCCIHYVSKFGKLSSGHRTGKGQYSFQSQRKAMPKNAQTTAQLHLSHMLVK